MIFHANYIRVSFEKYPEFLNFFQGLITFDTNSKSFKYIYTTYARILIYLFEEYILIYRNNQFIIYN